MNPIHVQPLRQLIPNLSLNGKKSMMHRQMRSFHNSGRSFLNSKKQKMVPTCSQRYDLIAKTFWPASHSTLNCFKSFSATRRLSVSDGKTLTQKESSKVEAAEENQHTVKSTDPLITGLLEMIFNAWKDSNIPYLEQIVKEYKENENNTVYDYTKAMWNTKPISIPKFPWAIQNGHTKSEKILKHLMNIMHKFYWFQNTSPQWTGVNEGRSDQSCVIIGDLLHAPVRSNKLLLGMMFIEGNNVYPAHAHDAKEVYYILAGSCFVKGNSNKFEEKRAGDIVIHEPNEIHALETKEESVLIVWGNTGDVHGNYYYLDN